MNWSLAPRITGIFALCLAFAVDSANSGQRSLKDLLIGTWELSSLYDEDERGQEALTFGLNPEGRLVLDGAGKFSLHIIDDSPLNAPGCSRSSAAVTRVMAGPTMLAYFGTYSIDSKSTIHLHVDRGLAPNWDNTDRVADVILIDNRMELISSIAASPTGSNYSHLVWHRLR
jgi:hypothetical protein